MKKLFACIMCGLLCFGMSGCSKKATYDNLSREEKGTYNTLVNIRESLYVPTSFKIEKVGGYIDENDDVKIAVEYNAENKFGAALKQYCMCDGDYCSQEEVITKATMTLGELPDGDKVKKLDIDLNQVLKAIENDKGYKIEK